MEERARKPFEGIVNIISFNRHFYILAFILFAILFTIKRFTPNSFNAFLSIVILLSLLCIFLSLTVSFYVYDYSHLYTLSWLNNLNVPRGSTLVNINAGFDETSYLLSKKYPDSKLIVFDFYDPVRHTEISIARARKRHSAHLNTITISTSYLPLKNESIDYFFCILSAHEIRSETERIHFFIQLKKALKENGEIVVVEHLRNLSNFVAYNVGFFHFFSHSTWKHTFNSSKLNIREEVSITPFIRLYFLQKNEFTS